MNNIGVSENKSIMPLSLITICNVILLLVRNYCVGNENHNFLLWNLFLGVVPFLIVTFLPKLSLYDNRFNTHQKNK